MSCEQQYSNDHLPYFNFLWYLFHEVQFKVSDWTMCVYLQLPGLCSIGVWIIHIHSQVIFDRVVKILINKSVILSLKVREWMCINTCDFILQASNCEIHVEPIKELEKTCTFTVCTNEIASILKVPCDVASILIWVE